MPANLTAQYRAAEEKLRAAKNAEETRAALQEMLSAIPKHKGTEKMQADIKRRLARLRQEAERRATPKAHHVHVDPEGAGQVVLLGAPNAGKSSLLAAVTSAEPTIADYPFSTTRPQPGMMRFEDVQVQLVDLPPVTGEHMDSWVPNVVQTADAALLVADASTPGVLTGIEEICERLAGVHLPLVGALPDEVDELEMPLPTLMVLAKVDRVGDDDLAVLEELYADRFPIVRFSAAKRVGLQQLKVAVWRLLGMVRVYTKPPGSKADRSEPFVVPAGSTVLDLAHRIHGDLAARLAYAKVWGGQIQGQRVSKDFELRDRDLVELGT